MLFIIFPQTKNLENIWETTWEFKKPSQSMTWGRAKYSFTLSATSTHPSPKTYGTLEQTCTLSSCFSRFFMLWFRVASCCSTVSRHLDKTRCRNNQREVSGKDWPTCTRSAVLRKWVKLNLQQVCQLHALRTNHYVRVYWKILSLNKYHNYRHRKDWELFTCNSHTQSSFQCWELPCCYCHSSALHSCSTGWSEHCGLKPQP